MSLRLYRKASVRESEQDWQGDLEQRFEAADRDRSGSSRPKGKRLWARGGGSSPDECARCRHESRFIPGAALVRPCLRSKEDFGNKVVPPASFAARRAGLGQSSFR